MATRKHLLTLTLVALGALASGGEARAQTHDLPFAQAGAALDYAGAEVRILYAAVTAKQFDLGFTKQTTEELGKALAEAKRSVDKADTLLPDNLKKMSEKLLALRERIVAAEAQLKKLEKLIVEQTKALTIEDEEERAELPPTDWKLLESETGWLGADVDAAQGAQAALAKGLGAPMPKKVARPKGKREG